MTMSVAHGGGVGVGDRSALGAGIVDRARRSPRTAYSSASALADSMLAC